jgi:hypothetical protein
MPKEEKIEPILKTASVFATVFCFVVMLPQVRSLIIEIGLKAEVLEVSAIKFNYNMWMKLLLTYFSVLAISCLIFSFTFLVQKTFIPDSIQNFIEKYGKRVFVYASAAAVAMSIVVRIIMYVKCRSLWLDEASLAKNIVFRNWSELLVPPLANLQSAPVLYVIAVKFICSVLGYSEFSLRIFSLFLFLGLLVCEVLLMKKAFNFDNFKAAVVTAITALSPSYIWYSNELKPYMGDAFFVVLAFLLYFIYTKGKIRLPVLTSLYVLLLGFSTPVIFFIGGILLKEFIAAILSKNKKQILFVVISGTVVLAVFGLYYHWWLSSVMDGMTASWGMPHISQLPKILHTGVSNSNSLFIWFFVPVAFLGIFSQIQSGDKIALSAALSLFLVGLASSIGKWPLTGRLWLFLPAIILIFTPCGIDFIRRKVKTKNIVDITEYFIFSVIIIFLSVNCLKYTGDEMYFKAMEVNSLISYVQENIKEDEKVYVNPYAKCVFEFKNGYNATKIGNGMDDNIIYGIDTYWNQDSLGNDLQSILSNKKVYLIFPFFPQLGIDKELSVLRNLGTLTEVMKVQDTPLYYFELEENKSMVY